jgi:hypothetical protein
VDQRADHLLSAASPLTTAGGTRNG